MDGRVVVESFQGADRFESRRRLGGGGFGAVYEVWDREHGELVALKVLCRERPR